MKTGQVIYDPKWGWIVMSHHGDSSEYRPFMIMSGHDYCGMRFNEKTFSRMKKFILATGIQELGVDYAESASEKNRESQMAEIREWFAEQNLVRQTARFNRNEKPDNI